MTTLGPAFRLHCDLQRAANAIESACVLLHWSLLPPKRLLRCAQSGKRKQSPDQNADRVFRGDRHEAVFLFMSAIADTPFCTAYVCTQKIEVAITIFALTWCSLSKLRVQSSSEK